MHRHFSNLFSVLLLCSLGLRLAFGAPCCWTGFAQHEVADGTPAHRSDARAIHTMAADEHGDHDPIIHNSAHGGHDGDNTAKPCCSACGPTLPPSGYACSPHTAPTSDHSAQALRDLATPAPAPAYEARGPPELV